MRIATMLLNRYWILLTLAAVAGGFTSIAAARSGEEATAKNPPPAKKSSKAKKRPKQKSEDKKAKPIVKAVGKEAALAQWAKVYTVLSHPRCANCHVGKDNRPRWSGPHYKYSFGVDQDWSYHAMNINGGKASAPGGIREGSQTLPCTTCHMQSNSPTHHGPPGAPIWALAPVEMEWWKKSSPQICAQIKDPARNGKRTLEQVAHHIEHDALVRWGWNPGPGRQPAPLSAQETAFALRVWAKSGAPCPPGASSDK